MAEKLNVTNDVTQAAKYEEFLAIISRRYIENCNEVLIEEIIEHAQKRCICTYLLCLHTTTPTPTPTPVCSCIL